MTDKKFKVGDMVKVTREFKNGEGKGDLSWISPDMDRLVGKIGKITSINFHGQIQLDKKWYFYPRVLEHVKKPHVARILTEKVTVGGVPCRKILGFDDISSREELPKKYTESAPSFWFQPCISTGAHVFDGREMQWVCPIGSEIGLEMKLPSGINIDVGCFMFTGMNVGDIWPEKTFQELLTWLRRAGSRLAKIRKQEKAAWSGKETVEI